MLKLTMRLVTATMLLLAFGLQAAESAAEPWRISSRTVPAPAGASDLLRQLRRTTVTLARAAGYSESGFRVAGHRDAPPGSPSNLFAGNASAFSDTH